MLTALEEYLPYMSDGEIASILFGGESPDAITVWGWEVRRAVRQAVMARQFMEAYDRQKMVENC